MALPHLFPFALHNSDVRVCTGCKAKKTADPVSKGGRPDKPLGKVVDDWAQWQPEDGLTELYPEDEATETKKKQLEEAISLMKTLGGPAEAVKSSRRI